MNDSLQTTKPQKQKLGLTTKILVAMIAGIVIGALLHMLPKTELLQDYVINGALDLGGKIFLTILKMLVVPIVFVSLVCGTCQLGDVKSFGRLAGKTLVFYFLTTALAITLALIIASLLGTGEGSHLVTGKHFTTQEIPSLKNVILEMFPSNPVAALASGNMLQVIIFSILFGLAITWSGEQGKRIANFFNDINEIVMQLMHMVISLAPIGVFCLVATIFARLGLDLIAQLIGYFITVLIVLFVHLLVSYPVLLRLFGKLNPLPFFRKMLPAMLFAFSTSSSNASIPVVLDIVEEKLGVKNRVASFIIPLGATVNMDGTAIMQGVATVFIANAYGIPLGLGDFLIVILTATLASVGTAGIPSVGLITLTMVLQQVGLPIEGIALIIGVDRLLDMTRTAINVAGDATVACIVGRSEKALDMNVYQAEE